MIRTALIAAAAILTAAPAFAADDARLALTFDTSARTGTRLNGTDGSAVK